MKNYLDDKQGYGYRVYVNNEDGTHSVYGHMVEGSSPFIEGQPIRAGDFVGEVGNTINSEAPHLHYGEQRGGAHINPISARDLYD